MSRVTVTGELMASDPCPHCGAPPRPGGGPVYEMGRSTTLLGNFMGQPVGHYHDSNRWTITYRCEMAGPSGQPRGAGCPSGLGWQHQGTAVCPACEPGPRACPCGYPAPRGACPACASAGLAQKKER